MVVVLVVMLLAVAISNELDSIGDLINYIKARYSEGDGVLFIHRISPFLPRLF